MANPKEKDMVIVHHSFSRTSVFVLSMVEMATQLKVVIGNIVFLHILVIILLWPIILPLN